MPLLQLWPNFNIHWHPFFFSITGAIKVYILAKTTDKKDFNQVTSSSYSSKICCNVFFRPVGKNIITYSGFPLSYTESPLWPLQWEAPSWLNMWTMLADMAKCEASTPVNCSPHTMISSFFTTAHWCSSSITAANRTCQSPRGILFSSTWYSCSPLCWTLRATLFCERTVTSHLKVLTPFPAASHSAVKKLKCASEVTSWWSQKDGSTICDFSQGRRTNVPELEDFSRRSCNSLPFP